MVLELTFDKIMSMLQNNWFMVTARLSKKDAVGKLLSTSEARVTLSKWLFHSCLATSRVHQYVDRHTLTLNSLLILWLFLSIAGLSSQALNGSM